MASTHAPTKPIAVIEADDSDISIETNHTSCDSYLYDSLPEGNFFRILELQPGRDNPKLQCKIATHTFDNSNIPPYRALSYTWKASRYDRLYVKGRRIPITDELHSKYDIRHPIWCDGKRLLISTNLRDALCSLRHPSYPLKIWVDALCINQEDYEERAKQVLLIQRIYHNAQAVWLWLGEDDEHSEPAIDLLADLCRIGSKISFNPATLPTLQDLHQLNSGHRKPDLEGLPPFPSFAWEALVRFFERPIWRRIWIVQELVTASRTMVYCGSGPATRFEAIIDGVLFLNMTSWGMAVETHYGCTDNNVSFPSAIADIRTRWVRDRSIKPNRLVYNTRRFEATDPRDKVYALIGLFNDFAHRQAWDLAGSPYSIEGLRAQGFDIDYVEDEPSEGLGALTEALNDIILREREKENDRVLNLLRSNSDENIRGLHSDILEFLDVAIDEVGKVFCEHTGQKLPRLSQVNRQQSDGHDDDVETEEYNPQYTEDLLKGITSKAGNLDKNDADQKDILACCLNFLETASGHMDKVMDLQASGYLMEEDISKVAQSRRALCNLRRKIGGDQDDDGDENEDDDGTEGGEWEDIESEESDADETDEEIGHRKSPGGQEYKSHPGHHRPLQKVPSTVNHAPFKPWSWSGKAVDYRLPVSEIYREFTLRYLMDSGDIDILSSIEDRSTRNIQELPSWVPDYSTCPTIAPLLSPEHTTRCPYKASGDTTSSPQWSPDEARILTLRAHIIGNITGMASSASASGKLSTQPSEWLAIISSLPSTSPSNELTETSLWRTLIGNRSPFPHPPYYPAPPRTDRIWHAFLAFNEVEQLEPKDPAKINEILVRHKIFYSNKNEPLEAYELMTQAMGRVMLGRRLFVMEDGRLGVAPRSTEVGDRVAIMRGGKVPFVIRKGEGEKEEWEIIGECYCHGWMDGDNISDDDGWWKEMRLR